jgi:uracil-DNA glycosylase
LILLIGRYAQEAYLRDNCKATLTETVAAFEEYLPQYFPLPHPSPRNRLWWKTNNWFERDVLPVLRERVATALTETNPL